MEWFDWCDCVGGQVMHDVCATPFGKWPTGYVMWPIEAFSIT